MKEYNKIAIISTLLILLIFILITQIDNDLLAKYFTLFGLPLTVVGLVFNYLQILSVKQSNEKAIKEVNIALNRINQVLVVSNISKAIKTISEIQGYIKYNNIPFALLRMSDIKSVLVEIKHIDIINYNQNGFDYIKIFSDFNNDFLNLYRHDMNKEKRINFHKIISNLDQASTYLLEIENEIKNRKYGN